MTVDRSKNNGLGISGRLRNCWEVVEENTGGQEGGESELDVSDEDFRDGVSPCLTWVCIVRQDGGKYSR